MGAAMNGATSNSEEIQSENKSDMNQNETEKKGKKGDSKKSKSEKHSGKKESDSKESKRGKKSDKKEDKTEKKSGTVTHVQYTEAMTMVMDGSGTFQIFKKDGSTDNSQNAIDDYDEDDDDDDYDDDMDSDGEVHREDYLNQTVAKYEGSDNSWTDVSDSDNEMETEITYTNSKEMNMVWDNGHMTIVTNDDQSGVKRSNYISEKAKITELPDDCDDSKHGKVPSQL